MRKFLKVFCVVLTLFFLNACDLTESSSSNNSVMQSISNQNIYFFYQNSCPHCHHAANYIRKKHPNLKMVNLDVRDRKGYDLFLKCAQKFHLPQDTLGTPLICMGTHYIMGWADEDEARFDSYVSRFK